MKKAEETYYEGYRVWKDEHDIPNAKKLFLKVLEIAPDPNFKYYKLAQEKLKELQ